jgi:hypothetical protein
MPEIEHGSPVLPNIIVIGFKTYNIIKPKLFQTQWFASLVLHTNNGYRMLFVVLELLGIASMLLITCYAVFNWSSSTLTASIQNALIRSIALGKSSPALRQTFSSKLPKHR